MLWISYGKNRYKKIAVTEKAIVVSLQVKIIKQNCHENYFRIFHRDAIVNYNEVGSWKSYKRYRTSW